MTELAPATFRVQKDEHFSYLSAEEIDLPVLDIADEFPRLGSITVDATTKTVYYGDGVSWVPIGTGGGGGATSNLADSGPGQSLIVDGTGPSLEIKKLIAGSNVTLVDGVAGITISSTGGGGGLTTLDDSGVGSTLIIEGTGPALEIKRIEAGDNINIDESAPDSIRISAVVAPTTLLSNAGPGATLITNGTGPNLGLKKLVAGTNVTFDETSAQNIIISATGSGGGGTLVNDSVSIGPSLLQTQSPADVTVKKLIPGVNVSIDDTSDPGALIISASGSGGSGSGTVERLTATTPNTVVTPSPFQNITYLNFTQTTGSTTGTLANGTVNGFEKTINYETGTTPYVLTITNLLDEFGVVASRTETFFQAGKSITYLWNAAKTAWMTKAKIQPYSYTTVTIRLDPADPTQATAIRNDGYVYPLRGLNTNVLATNTLMPFLTAISTNLLTRGGGTVFFPAGKYYFQTWTSTTPYLRILGEPGTKFIPGGNPNSQSPALAINAIYNVVQWIEFIGEAPWTNFFIDGIYSETGGINCGYCDYSIIRDCSFNYMSAVSGRRMRGVVMERNVLTGTKGGLQSGREVYQCMYANNYVYNAIDDCLHFFFNAQNNIIANNTVDCFVSLTRGGGGVGVRLANKDSFPENSNVVITGNNFANIANAAIGCGSNVHSVTVTGNTFYKCCTSIREESQFYISGNFACIDTSGYFPHHWVIANNTFQDMFRAIVYWGQNALIANNVYENVLRDNVIVAGNTITDTDVLTGKDIVFQGDSHTWKTIAKVPTIGQRTGRGVMSSPQSYTSTIPPRMTTVIIPSMPRGVETISLEIAIAYSGGPLPGTKLTFQYSDSDGNPWYVGETTFTVPALTNILTQPRTVIPIVSRLTPDPILAVITPPNGETLIMRSMVAGTPTGSTSMGISGREFDYVLNVNQLLPTPAFTVGGPSGATSQVTVGPLGTGINQIRNYPITANLPVIPAGQKTAMAPITAAGMLPTDALFLGQTLDSTLPSNILLGSVIPGTENFTLSFVNFSGTPYSDGDLFSFVLMAVRRA